MKFSLVVIGLAAADVVYKECESEIMNNKAIHHGTYYATGRKVWPFLQHQTKCGRQHACTEKECAAACEGLEACVGWTYGNRNRCYLLDAVHKHYASEAPTNGVFNSAICKTMVKECNDDFHKSKAIHHGTYGVLGSSSWPQLQHQTKCGRQHACTEKECAAACEGLEACVGWTYGNRARCYLLDSKHLEFVDQAPTNGAFNSATCTDSQQENIDVEMTVDYTEDEFTTKKDQIKDSIAGALGVKAEDIEITKGVKPNPIKDESRRRLTSGLLITVTFKVAAAKVAEIVNKLETPAFTKATGAAFVQFKPAKGSSVCATCSWDGHHISVTHYINAQGAGKKGLKHKCYHTEDDKCKCICE